MSIAAADCLVIKIGSSTLTYPNGKPNFKKFEKLARILSDLKNEGRNIVLVSSGAVAVGLDRMGVSQRNGSLVEKQAAAAVGQCELMFIYDKFFSEYNQVVAQILITRDIIEDPVKKQNAENTLRALLAMDVIPIVNENDTVATEELDETLHSGEMVFSDNDRLSAIVAKLIQADGLVLITDIDGLYDKNPAEHDDAKKISVVEEITETLYQSAGGSGSNRGRGGMLTKLGAAELAVDSGIDTVILSGERLDVLYDLLAGKPVGTWFKAKQGVEK